MSFFQSIKGYFAGAIALVACPCHLPITFPILLSLTAGTVFGSWLVGNFWLLFGVLTVIFLGGLGLMFLWSWGDKKQEPGKTKELSRSESYTGSIQVTLVTSPTCQSCAEAKTVWQTLERDHSFHFEAVEINSSRGRKLAAEHNIFSTPTTLINGRVVYRGVPPQSSALEIVMGT